MMEEKQVEPIISMITNMILSSSSVCFLAKVLFFQLRHQLVPKGLPSDSAAFTMGRGKNSVPSERRSYLALSKYSTT